MNNDNSNENSCDRRAFLGRGAATLGTLVLALGEARAADAPATVPAREVVLKLADHPNLAKVGGSTTVKAENDTIIVARVSESEYVALSAICTHRGCEVGYDGEAKQFACPCHRARFALDGSVVKGPAKLPLKQYSPQSALVIGGK